MCIDVVLWLCNVLFHFFFSLIGYWEKYDRKTGYWCVLVLHQIYWNYIPCLARFCVELIRGRKNSHAIQGANGAQPTYHYIWQTETAIYNGRFASESDGMDRITQLAVPQPRENDTVCRSVLAIHTVHLDKKYLMNRANLTMISTYTVAKTYLFWPR